MTQMIEAAARERRVGAAAQRGEVIGIQLGEQVGHGRALTRREAGYCAANRRPGARALRTRASGVLFFLRVRPRRRAPRGPRGSMSMMRNPAQYWPGMLGRFAPLLVHADFEAARCRRRPDRAIRTRTGTVHCPATARFAISSMPSTERLPTWPIGSAGDRIGHLDALLCCACGVSGDVLSRWSSPQRGFKD